MADKKKGGGLETVARNKKAYHDYFVLESFEAGIELFGTEVKSVRQGKVNLKDAWCSIEKGEIYVNGMHISPYEFGNIFNRDPMRKRRLLMHKREINRLYGTLKQQGLTLIPLSAYFNRGRLKIQVGLCKGKKNYDKRESIARKDAEREAARELRSRNNY
jgi:SsrA-binding protein